MTDTELRRLMRMLADEAPALRRAGILSAKIAGVELVLAPAVPESDGAVGGDPVDDDAPVDVLKDSWTRGVPNRAKRDDKKGK